MKKLRKKDRKKIIKCIVENTSFKEEDLTYWHDSHLLHLQKKYVPFDEIFACHLCGDEFDNEEDYKKHLDEHEHEEE